MSAWALLLLGFAVAGVHRVYDYSLSLPGHHGLELLTAMMFARLNARERWAMLILATGTAGGDLVFAADVMHSLKQIPLYYLAGGLMDLLYSILGARCRMLPVAGLVGAVVHLTRPLTKMAFAAVTGVSFGFFRHGEVFPLVTHAAFGAVGAICGALLARAVIERRKSSAENS